MPKKALDLAYPTFVTGLSLVLSVDMPHDLEIETGMQGVSPTMAYWLRHTAVRYPDVEMDPFADLAGPDAGRRQWRRPCTWLLLGALLLLLTVRQLFRAYTAQIDIIHLGYLLQYFEMFDQGLLWGSSPGSAGLTFKLNGSLSGGPRTPETQHSPWRVRRTPAAAVSGI